MAIRIIRDRSFFYSFFSLSGTLILEQAVILSVNLIDNLMIGNYSELSLAAVAAVNQIQFVVQQILFGVANSLLVLTSQYWGKQQTEPICQLAAIGLRTALLIGFLMFTIISLFPAECMGIFCNDARITAEGIRYLRIIRFTYPVFAATTLLLALMRSVETVHLALRVSVVSLVINCILNFILITGRFGAPELGIVGAAIGTLTARVLECGIVVYYVLKKDRKLSFRFASLKKQDPILRMDYLRTAAPITYQSALWGVFNAIQIAILGHMAASVMTAYSISSTMFLLLKVTSVGACTAASILTGKQIGAGGKTQLKEMVVTMQLLFVGIGLALGLLLFVIRVPLLHAYHISAETRAYANAFLCIQSVIICTMSYQMPVNSGILRGGGDIRYLSILDTISIWGIVIPLSYLAAFRWGASPIVVVILLNSDQIFKGIPAFIRVNFCHWAKDLVRNGSFDHEK